MGRPAARAQRERMVASAAQLLGSQGPRATTFSEVVRTSGAPRGSIYHYFPQGKRQLVEESVRWTEEQVLDHQRRYTGRTPAGVVDHFVGFFRRAVVASKYHAGCPVAAVVVGAYVDGESAGRAVSKTFRSWTDLLAEQLIGRGVAPERARTVSVMTVAGIEGALILSRAEGTVEPLDRVARELRRSVSVGRVRA
jgi:TetR/AcrR family transcriptional regulator, lmrAB and yxaGH operons repressor